MAEESDVERTSVRTYVPRYQKERWREHADALGMSQSEYVRTMVQSGRRGFELEPESGESIDEQSEPEGSFHPSHPGGNGLETRVLSTLSDGEVMSWDQLVEALSGDLEDRLDDALEELQQENRIRYRGRDGGYTLVDQ